MATRQQNQGVTENLRKQLALAVKNIQWSYSIFWSISSRQPGVLEWGDGYYNGDIKTRKTIQAVELKADQLGLQRTQQLSELYESLSAAETNPHARRPSAALSPEDLTDTEWYFLVCMSFVFNIGQGLPGRTLANNQTIWLCNAQYADSKVFCRSLLAKSASIQTVVCFPYLGGVVEFGVTELVLEDPIIIQHIKTYFLEVPSCPVVPKISKHVSDTASIEKDFACTKHDQDIVDTSLINPVLECEEANLCSPSNSSSAFKPNLQAEESIMVEGIYGGAFQVQSWQFMDDEISNCIHNSMNSSDCISQDLQAIDFRKDDIHYQRVLSTLLKSSYNLIMGACFQNSNNIVSSFVAWKNGGLSSSPISRGGTPQRLLKKVLFEVARMHGSSLLKSREDNSLGEKLWRPKADEIDTNHVLSERRQKEKLNERFSILGTLVPSTGKVGKVSILDDTIEYLKELEQKVEKLESGKEVLEVEARRRRKPRDIAERTSDNCGENRIDYIKKPLMNKRKACDINETEAENNQVLLREYSSTDDDLTVSVIEKNVMIEIHCPWREGLLLEMIDATSNLDLDSHSVQSSNVDGILSLTIRSKLKGSTLASAGMIGQALQRVIRKC